MGYTHYFGHKKTSKINWAMIVEDCKKLQANLPKGVLIDGCFAYPVPQFTDKMIHFNGTDEGFTFEMRKDDSCPKNSHETFELLADGVKKRGFSNGGMPFTFCKTARKPYDLLVCGCLLVYKHHSPATMELSSDGDAEDWADAEKFVKDTLGYEVKFAEVRSKE